MISSERLEFKRFVDAVVEYQLDGKDQKTTSHTSAVSVRWEPPVSAPTTPVCPE
jgi:hypothetical protein